MGVLILSKKLSDVIKELYKAEALDINTGIELKQTIKESIEEIKKRPRAI